MSYDNSDWFAPSTSTEGASNHDEWGVFSSGSAGHSNPKKRWAVLLSVVSLVLVAAACFFSSFLTKDMAMRPAWVMGLMFFTPAAVALGALITENLSNSMTPRFSRKAQAIVALLVMLIPFVVGLFSGALIQPVQRVYFGQYMLIRDRGDTDRAEDSNVSSTDLAQAVLNYLPNNVDVGLVDFGSMTNSQRLYAEQYILLLDRSVSIEGTDPDRESATAIETMLSQLSDQVQVGLIVFSHEILHNIPIGALNGRMRAKIADAISQEPEGTTNFELPLTEALNQLEASKLAKGKPTQLIMLTDGEASITNVQAMADRCARNNTIVSCVKLGSGINFTLEELVEKTGGEIVEVDKAEDLLDALLTVSASSQKAVLQTVSLAPLNDSLRMNLSAVIQQQPTVATDTIDPVAHALDQLEADGSNASKITSLIVVTDGMADTFQQDYRELIKRCNAGNIRVSWVKEGSEANASLAALATQTNGSVVDIGAGDSLPSAILMDSVAIEMPDALRRQDSGADMVAAIVFSITGLVIGIGLSIMLSQQGQRRFQMILSPLMGVAAFFLCKKVLPGTGMPEWCVEWSAFSLYGLIFMKKNR